MDEDQVARIMEALSAKGLRRTAPRQAIATALVEGGSHVTAEELARRVQQRFPSINISTVYRTLEALEEIGIVDHVHLGHGRAIYHLADDEHQHLVCERCQRVEELPAAKLQPLLQTLEQDFGFELDRRHFAIVGLCRGCRGAAVG